MGVDARLFLPGNVRVHDVASVLGILFGLPHALEPLTGGDGVLCRVRGANVRGHIDIPAMAEIELRAPNGDHVAGFYYHFENPSGRRQLTGRSTAKVIAAFKYVADFFGGRVDYQDCDDEDLDYVAPDKSDEENHADDGEAWDAFQRRMDAVEALEPIDIRVCKKFAAYGDER